jgi:predicted lipoprotein with Yx(FWY)xxD motif
MVFIAAVVAIAGCGSDSDDGAPAQSSSGVVSVKSVDGSDVLVDRQGRTLYSADVEKGGKILCTGGCVAIWKPVLGSSNEAKSAGMDLSTVMRPDGESQLTFEGLPLYTFTEEGAGQLTGDGFSDKFAGTMFEWHAARSEGGSSAPAKSPSSGYGY